MNANNASKSIKIKLSEIFSHDDDIIDINVTRSSRILGFIVSNSFNDMLPTERQEKVWAIIDQLPPEIRQFISLLLTLTPEEMKSEDEAA